MEDTATVAVDKQLPYRTVEQFLKHIERRAFHMARISTGNADSAMDIVQDSMYKLVEKYSTKQACGWRPLFYRILSRRLNYYVSEITDPIDRAEGRRSETPDEMMMRSQRIQRLNYSVQQLPNRQRQAFMLRCWEGLSTIETANAMEISTGSVKTHYSRAMHALRDMLEDYRHD